MENAKPVSTPLANHFRLSTIRCPKTNDDIQGNQRSHMQVKWGIRCMLWFVQDQIWHRLLVW